MDTGSFGQENMRKSWEQWERERFKLSVDNWNKVRRIRNLEHFLTCAHAVAYQKKKNPELRDFHETEKAVDKIKITFASNIFLSLLDMITSFINGYLAFAIPYRLAFFPSHQIGLLYIHDLILDSVLFFHFVIKLISPTSKNSLLHEISVQNRFTYNFMRIRLYTDFLSIIPLYMISNKYYWFKLGRILRVTSIFGWMEESIVAKKLKKKNFFLIYYETFQSAVYSLKLMVLLMITCHCIACLWFYIPNSLSAKNENTWLGEDWRTYSYEDNYMRSLYWTAVTFSSVGYGDITGKTTEEYFYSMFIEFLGIICFAYLMGSLTSSISQYYEKKDQAKLREIELTNWIIFLQENIKDKAKKDEIDQNVFNFFKLKWNSNPRSLNNFDEYLMMMPQGLAEELTYSLYSSHLKLFGFFDTFSDRMKLEISTLMFSQEYSKRVEIIKEGSLNKKIFFIVSGTVAAGIKKLGYPIELGNGSNFGEDSAIFEDNSRISIVVKCQRVCVLHIEWPLLFKVLKNHNVKVMSHAKLAFKRAKYFYEASEYKYASEYYVSDDELCDFAAKFNLQKPKIEYDELNEFNDRAEKLMMKLFGKKNQSFDLPEEVAKFIEKKSEDVNNDVLDLHNSYKSGLEELVEKVKILENLTGR